MTADVGKLWCGELEDDAEDLDFLLPPRVVIGPDENGLKKVIEYRFDDEGNKVRVTTTVRVRKLTRARLSKRALERRSWPKFGDAAREDSGDHLTMVSTEEILLERPRAPGSILLPSRLISIVPLLVALGFHWQRFRFINSFISVWVLIRCISLKIKLHSCP